MSESGVGGMTQTTVNAVHSSQVMSQINHGMTQLNQDMMSEFGGQRPGDSYTDGLTNRDESFLGSHNNDSRSQMTVLTFAEYNNIDMERAESSVAPSATQ